MARVMIVEDEFIIIEEVKMILENIGYEVVTTTNMGETAIELAESQNPDIILMDIRIKGKMDGIEDAHIIHPRFNIPIIFMTAFLDKKRIERVKLTMPFGYILKPIWERDLKINIEMALFVSKVDKRRRKAEADLQKAHFVFSSSSTIRHLLNAYEVFINHVNLIIHFQGNCLAFFQNAR